MNRQHYQIQDIIRRRNSHIPIKPMVNPFDAWLDANGHYLYWGVMLLAFVVAGLSLFGVL